MSIVPLKALVERLQPLRVRHETLLAIAVERGHQVERAGQSFLMEASAAADVEQAYRANHAPLIRRRVRRPAAG